MRIFITITEEPVYINPFIKKVVQAAHSEIVGVAIVEGSVFKTKRKQNFLSYFNYLLTIMIISVIEPIHLIRKSIILIAFNVFNIFKPLGIKNPFSITKILDNYKIPVIYTKNVNSSDFIEFLKQKRPDIVINQAQSILKKEFLSVPTIGCLNRHGALLPKYRGRLAPFWAYLNGEKETGVSIHFVEEGIDSGPILVQKRIKIERFDLLHSLVEKIFEASPGAMLEAIELIRTGEYKTHLIKNDDEQSSYFSSPKISDAMKYISVVFNRILYPK